MRDTAAPRTHSSSGVHVGCSGWQYRHWRGSFYPADLPQRHWFAYYAARFDTVEINNTFYRLPEQATFKAWKSKAPRGFLYAVKASRFLTHMKRLKNPDEPIARLFSCKAFHRDVAMRLNSAIRVGIRGRFSICLHTTV